MERVRDVTKIRMFQGSVMIKIVLKNQKIIAPDKSRVDNLTDYAEIIKVSPDVTDLKEGDIVLDFRTSEAFDWRGDKYAIIPRMSIKIALPREEFEFPVVKEKSGLKN